MNDETVWAFFDEFEKLGGLAKIAKLPSGLREDLLPDTYVVGSGGKAYPKQVIDKLHKAHIGREAAKNIGAARKRGGVAGKALEGFWRTSAKLSGNPKSITRRIGRAVLGAK